MFAADLNSSSLRALMCICYRESADVVCTNGHCSFKGYGRVRKYCQLHPKVGIPRSFSKIPKPKMWKKLCTNFQPSTSYGFGPSRSGIQPPKRVTFLLDLAVCPWCGASCVEVVKIVCDTSNSATVMSEGSATAAINKKFRPILNHASRPKPRNHPLFKATE